MMLVLLISALAPSRFGVPLDAPGSAPAVAVPATAAPVQPGSDAASAVPVMASTLARAAFDAVMAESPQRVVAAVDVKPALVGRRFVGFRLLRIRPEGILRDCTSLVPGDVIVSVNREPLERPEQFMRAWEVVKNASAIEVEVERGGRRILYRWTLVP